MMDAPKYSTLTEAIADVLDPRKARGKRHPWGLIMTLIAAALVAGQRNGRAIGQWVREHADELRRELALPPQPLPSTATLRRALRSMDVTDLEARLAQFTQDLAATTAPQPGARYQGQAVDGKAVRGAQAQGAKVHLVSLVQHGTGLVRKQVRVREKSNEITAVPALLQGQDLQGTVTTMDALLTQRTLAQQILDQQGDYLMVVKENQPALYAAIE
ncbi:MAG: ISAs1 family transposase, partial [Chloroflexi bacterium]|nr:ISAs1 family transposase [Chloroflexota bacterium]